MEHNNEVGAIELQHRHQANNDEPSDPQTTPPIEHPTGAKLALITLGLILSIFLAALDSSILATAIPSITDEFSSISDIAWYGSAYTITNTAYQSCWGKAYNYFPLKPTFLLTILTFEVGNVVSAVAPNSATLILGRVVAGVGGGGVMTGCFIIVALVSKEEWRAAYMGVFSVTFGVSSVVGPLIGGMLTDGPGWRWCFWISLPIGFCAAAVMFFFFSSPVPPRTASLRERILHTDLLGGTIMTGSLSCFVMTMHATSIYGWSSPHSLPIFISGILLFLLFTLNEYHLGPRAMIQPHLLTNRSILPNLIYSFFLAGVFFPLLYTLPVQFQSVHNTSASQSGIRLIPLVLGVSVFTMLANGLLTFWRHYKPLLLLGAILGTAGVSKIYTLGANATTADWIGFEVLTAVGVGIALQIPMIANQTHVAVDDIPSVTALSLFAENLGTTLFVAAGEAAFTQGLMSAAGKNMSGAVDPQRLLHVGATQIRRLFSGKELAQVLSSYLEGCQISHVISVACGAGACLVSLGSAGPAGVREVRKMLGKVHSP